MVPELHFIVADNGDEQAKTHACRQHKTNETDHRYVVPMRWNARQHDERAAHNQGSQYYGIGNPVGDAFQGQLQGLDAAVLKAYAELAVL